MDLARIALNNAKQDARRRATRANGAGGRRRRGWPGSAPVLLAQALNELIDQAGWSPAVPLQLRTAWLELSSDLARHITLSRYDPAGVLEVRADSKAWATQTGLLAPRLLNLLNELLAPAGIRPIHRLVVTGTGGETLPPLPQQRPDSPRRPTSRALWDLAAPEAETGDPVIASALGRQAQQASREPLHRHLRVSARKCRAVPASHTAHARALQRAQREAEHTLPRST